jgi:hypothetical protein
MLLHACGAVGLEFFHLGLLVGRQYLEELIVNARLLYCQFDLDLRFLRRQGADFSLVIRTLRILAELLLDLARLLEQRLYDRMFLLQNRFDLRPLGIAQIQRIGEKSQPMLTHAESMAVAMYRGWSGSRRISGLGFGDDRSQQDG